jgi:hypothetical protein
MPEFFLWTFDEVFPYLAVRTLSLGVHVIWLICSCRQSFDTSIFGSGVPHRTESLDHPMIDRK